MVSNSLVLVATEILTKLLGLLFFALMARFLGPGDIGLYAFAVTLANFLAIAPRFGFERLVQREIARRGLVEAGFYRELMVLKGLLAAAVLGLFAGCLWLLRRPDGGVLFLIALFIVAYSFLEFVSALFRGVQRPAYELATRLVFSLSTLGVGSAVLFMGGDLISVVWVQIGATGLAVLSGMALVRRLLTGIARPLQGTVLTERLREATPFAMVLVALYCSNQLGVLLLSAIQGREEVGYLAASLRLFDNLTLVPAAIMGAFLPRMSELYVRSVARFVHTMQFAVKYLFILSAPLVVGTVILAGPLIGLLYGETFMESAADLRILMVALIFSFWNYMCDSVLVAGNRERLLSRLIWIEAGVYLCANLALIPVLSHRGACWAVLVTQVVHFAILMRSLRRYTNVRRVLGLIRAPAFCVLAMGVVVYGLRDWNLLVPVLAGAGTYAGLLIVSGTVGWQEVALAQGKGVATSHA